FSSPKIGSRRIATNSTSVSGCRGRSGSYRRRGSRIGSKREGGECEQAPVVRPRQPPCLWGGVLEAARENLVALLLGRRGAATGELPVLEEERCFCAASRSARRDQQGCDACRRADGQGHVRIA